MSHFPIFIDMTDRQVLVVGSWKCGIEAGRRAGKIWRSDHGDCTEHFEKRYGSWRIHGKSV